jgi:hypothetical protein
VRVHQQGGLELIFVIVRSNLTSSWISDSDQDIPAPVPQRQYW